MKPRNHQNDDSGVRGRKPPDSDRKESWRDRRQRQGNLRFPWKRQLRPGATAWLALGLALLGAAALAPALNRRPAWPVPAEAARPDLNRATQRELAASRGCHADLARRLIVRRRALHGFKGWEEVRSVRGVGPATLEQLQRDWSLNSAGDSGPDGDQR